MLVASGNARVSTSSSIGETLVLSYYSGSGIIGELEFMLGGDYTRTMKAATEVACITIPATMHHPYLMTCSLFSTYVGVFLAQKLHRSTSNSTVNILSSTKIRLCAYISLTANDGLFDENLAAAL